MRNPTYKENNLAIFHQMQTTIMLAKIAKTETQTNTALNILPPAIMNLIGVYLLMPGKLDHLLALVIFLQQDSALNTPEVTQINRTLNEAISTNNFTSEYVDPVYNTTFTSIIELIGNRKEELLREAAKAGNELAVMQLLKIDPIDVNAKNDTGRTALMWAAGNGHTSIVTQLLNAKDIAVNASDDLGHTALMWAAGNGHTSIVTQLLNAKDIAVNANDNLGWTALMSAAMNGHTSIVTQLLNAKDIAVNAKNISGGSALKYAAINGHTPVVTQLLNFDGILVNAKDNNGWTALMWAAINGHTSVMHQLCVKQLFDAPYGQCSKLFQQLTNEVKSVTNSMTINPASLCANFLVSVSALPTADVKITLLEKALSKSNAFSALMQNEDRLLIEEVLTKLNSSQEAQSSNNTQLVIFSPASGVSSSSSNTAHTSTRLISNQ